MEDYNIMLKQNPTKTWLKKKIKGYMEQDEPVMAERFIQAYINKVDDLTLAEAKAMLKKSYKKDKDEDGD